MVIFAGNTTVLTTNAITSDLVEQPAGAWGSWIPPVIYQAPSPMKSGAVIYRPVANEIQRLRNSGFITDESSMFYQLRIANTLAKVQQTSTIFPFQIPSARIWRALSVLELTGMISRFSIDELRLNWIKIAAAKPSADQIKADWQRKYIDDLGYVHEVLEFLRGTSTTQSVPLARLYPDWQITNIMLGNCLNSLASVARNIVSATISNLTVEWRTPVPPTGVSKEELQSFRGLGLIGDSLYVYLAIRSLKAGGNQVIAPSFFLENWSIRPDTLLTVLWALRQSGIILKIQIQKASLRWLIPVPNYNISIATKLQRSFLSEAGDFMFALGAFNANRTTEQNINVSDIVQKLGLKYKKFSYVTDAGEIAIALLMRMIDNDVVSLTDCDPISITWAY
jgi:hypothetical protein